MGGDDRPRGDDRLGLARVTPAFVPDDVRLGGGSSLPARLPVGSPGKVGVLELGFRRVGERTELTHRFQKSPLQVMRPLYGDRGAPGVPTVYVMSTGGGIVGGDRLRLDLDVGPDAHALVTTQAATKVHRAEHEYASQVVGVDVADGGVCEYLPDALIPFGGSRFHQHIEARVAAGGTLVLADVVAAGRLGRGECWELGAYSSTVEISRGPEPLVVDTTRLVGSERGGGVAVMGEARAVGTLFVVTDRVPAGELADLLHSAVEAVAGVSGGASTLPEESGAWVRVLGHDTDRVEDAVTAAWSAARLAYAGLPAPELRKT